LGNFPNFLTCSFCTYFCR